MGPKKRRRGPPIHRTIKERLGYSLSDSDDDVYQDWKERISRVCKPCWELKYCPYGPLVEKLPTLPSLRASSEEHMNYFKQCLQANTVGDVTQLSDERRAIYKEWLEDEDVLLHQAYFNFRQKNLFESLEKIEGESEQISAWLNNKLPRFI